MKYLFTTLIGCCWFSFLNVIVRRYPLDESPFSGRSHCPHCGRVLAPWEMLPCVSYLALRGKCHSCGGRIPGRDFWVELLGGAAFTGCVVRFGTLRGCLAFMVTFLLTAVALLDWDTMEIPNGFPLAIALCTLPAMWLFPEISAAERAFGAACVSVPMLILTLLIRNAFGGGDIKLMFAMGLFLGWKNTLLTMFFAVLSGGGYAILLLIFKRADRKDQFAFGPFLCLAAALSMFCGEKIINWYVGLW